MIVAGNWKMQKTCGEARAWVEDLLEASKNVSTVVRIRVYPSFIALDTVARAAAGSRLEVGAQNLHPERSGAFTGEISAPMILDAGVERVLIGHSERRHLFHEDDGFLAKKVRAALGSGLLPLFCIGEDLAEREGGRTTEVLTRQIERGLGELAASDAARLEIAYEPVWAIGTGKVATTEQVAEAHTGIREVLGRLWGAPGREVPLLYGGSVKPSNAAEILALPAVDGVLVGGASLEVPGFIAIAEQAEKCA
ncbi:MAG: triose-phosphate isomerase [Candidatus Eisenbacteria bacterium]